MPIVAELNDAGRVELESDMPFRDTEQMRTIPGSRFKNNTWTVPCTWASYQTLYGFFGVDNLTIGPKFLQWAAEEYETRVKRAMELRLATDAEGAEFLYNFQRAGVEFLKTAKRALLCDLPGSGKTVQTIMTLRSLWEKDSISPFPALIVAPKNMTRTWEKEFHKWFPGLTVTNIIGNVAKRRKAIATPSHVYVVNYEGLKAHSRLAPYGSIRLRRCQVCDPSIDDPKFSQARCHWCRKELNEIPFKTVVVDEVHRLQDPKSQQTRACWAVATDATDYRYGLTGTPVTDAPETMWGALHFIAPEEHPSKSAMIDRYCQTTYNPFSNGAQIIGLRQDTGAEFFAIVDPRMRRMPKEAVLPFLPPKLYGERYVEMTSKQATAYNQMTKGSLARVEGGVVVGDGQLGSLVRLSQFASAFAEIDEQGRVRLTEPSNKIDTLLEVLADLRDESVVVFAQSKQLIDLAAAALEKHNYTYAMIVGGQTEDQREQQKEMFQQGKVQVILCTIAAGGIGITLTRASTAVFLQRSWSQVENLQAEDRVHRIGSEIHDHINIIDIISIGTLEISQRKLLEEKTSRLQEVVRDQQMLRQLLEGEEFEE